MRDDSDCSGGVVVGLESGNSDGGNPPSSVGVRGNVPQPIKCCKCGGSPVAVGIRATYKDEDEHTVGYRYYCKKCQDEQLKFLVRGQG